MKATTPMHPEPPSPTPAALDYAPAPPVHHRRWFRKLVLSLILLSIGATVRWGQPIYHRAAFLYHQRVCMNYAAPADQVVLDSDPAHVAALAKDPPECNPHCLGSAQE